MAKAPQSVGHVQVGQVIKSKYQLLEELGRGGMGVVFRAVDVTLQRSVAVKFQLSPNPDQIARFIREALATTRVDHPQVVQIYEVDKTDDGILFIVMEYVRGEALIEPIKRAARAGSKIGPDFGVAIAWQLASVLTATHDKGVVHRDLKPGNVMLVPYAGMPGDVQIKILDFGIAKILPSALSDTNQDKLGAQLTHNDQRPGTPVFMAPEQWRTSKSLDTKVDVYALGCMLYLFLAGQVPFTAPDSIGLEVLHAIEPPKPLHGFDPTLSPELVAICEQMLAKKPEDRPAMQEVRDRLGVLLGLHAPNPARRLRSVEVQAIPRLASSDSSEPVFADTASAPTQDQPSLALAKRPLEEISTPVMPKASHPDAIVAQQSSGLVSRGTGQQQTSDETRAKRRRRRVGAIGATAMSLLAIGGVGIWRMRVPVVTSPATGNAPSVQVAPKPLVAAITETKQPLETPNLPPVAPEPKTPKAATRCVLVDVDQTCLDSSVEPRIAKAISKALHDNGVQLCAGDKMVITPASTGGLPTVQAPRSVPPTKRKDLSFSLSTHLQGLTLSGKVEIRCKR